MKKIYILTQAKDRMTSVEALRDLGLLHIEHVHAPTSKELNDLQQQIQNLEKACSILEPFKASAQITTANASHLAQEIIDLEQERKQINEQLGVLKALVKEWGPWGEFEPNDIRYLLNQGIHLELYELTEKELRRSKEEFIVISKDKKNIRAVGINLKDAPYRKISLPEQGLKHCKHQARVMERRRGEIEQAIAGYGQYYKECTKHLSGLKGETEFYKTAFGMGQDEEIIYLKGFAPFDTVEMFRMKAAQNNWGLLIEDPSSEDKPPTLLRNPAGISMIKPVLDFMNIVPGYHEQDVSFVFLLFFTLFFSILIGDAGYGSVYMFLLFILQKKLAHKVDRKVFFLGYTLSAGAIVWGVLTGTYFGTALTANLIKPAVPWLTEQINVQKFVFTVGVIHLTIAHAWRAYNKFVMKNKSGLIDVGWILMLWACYCAVLYFVVNAPLSPLAIPLALTGAVLIAVFSKFDIVGLYLGSLGAFGDIVSYIRLFAVGLAGTAVADAFNNMGMMIGFSDLGKTALACLVLFVGHALNMVLSMFAIMVHGIRLKVMEFSSHLGLEWNGLRYQPLKK